MSSRAMIHEIVVCFWLVLLCVARYVLRVTCYALRGAVVRDA